MITTSSSNTTHVVGEKEKPMEAGRELDILIAEKVMGYVWRKSAMTGRRCLYPPYAIPYWMSEQATGSEPLVTDWERINFPRFSTDISDAWRVVEWLRSQYTNVSMGAANGWGFSAWDVTMDDDYLNPVHGNADTLPHAICLAALKARSVGTA